MALELQLSTLTHAEAGAAGTTVAWRGHHAVVYPLLHAARQCLQLLAAAPPLPVPASEAAACSRRLASQRDGMFSVSF